jgi:hypothetical protein
VLSFPETLAALHALLGEHVHIEVAASSGIPVAYLNGTLVCNGDMGPDAAVRFSFREYDSWACGFWVDPYPELYKGAERSANGDVSIYCYGGAEITVGRDVRP